MYCNKCGNQLRDGAKFCNNCGAPIEEITNVTTDRLSAFGSFKEFSKDKPDNSAVFSKDSIITKQIKKKKKAVIVISLLLVGVIILILCLTVNNICARPSKKASFSIPEALVMEEENDDTDSLKLLSTSSNSLFGKYFGDYQSSDNGLFAYITEDDSTYYLLVYNLNGEMILKKQTNGSRFFLSRDGSKVVYCSTNNNSFVINEIKKSREKEVKVEGKFLLEGISYDGSEVVISESYGITYYKNGRKHDSLNSWSNLLCVSDDGSYIYYFCSYHNTNTDFDGNTISEEDVLELYVYHNGVNKKITDLKNGYNIVISAINKKGNEILYWNDSLYYYNNDTSELKIISGTSKMISSFEQVISEYYGGEVNNRSWNQIFSQDKVLNSFYIDIDNGDNCSVGYLNEKYEYIILASTNSEYDFVSWLSISDDRQKLWCVKNGVLTYYAIEAHKLITYSCNLPVMMNKSNNNDHPLISSTSDGNKACFISTDGVAFTVTPETISTPVRVLDNARIPTFSADNRLFIRTGSSSEDLLNARDLYLITDDNQAVFQQSNVVLAVPTSKGLYVVCANDNSSLFTVYKENNNQYSLVSDKFETSIFPIWL